MFDPNFFNFDFLGFALMASVVIPPLFGDLQDWIPDFAKQFGTYIKDGFANIVGGISDFISEAVTKIGEIFKSLYDEFTKWLNYVWDFVKAFFEYIKETIANVFVWVGGTLATFYEWLGDTISDFWDLLSETVTNFCSWCIETIFYFAECIFEYLLLLLDWAVGVMVGQFEWLFGEFPTIELPAGFEEGLSQFISFGMILDRILPVKETLGLLALYVLILVCLTLYKFIIKVVFAILEVIP